MSVLDAVREDLARLPFRVENIGVSEYPPIATIVLSPKQDQDDSQGKTVQSLMTFRFESDFRASRISLFALAGSSIEPGVEESNHHLSVNFRAELPLSIAGFDVTDVRLMWPMSGNPGSVISELL